MRDSKTTYYCNACEGYLEQELICDKCSGWQENPYYNEVEAFLAEERGESYAPRYTDLQICINCCNPRIGPGHMNNKEAA